MFLERPTSVELTRGAHLVCRFRDPKTPPYLSYDGLRSGTLGRTASAFEEKGGSGLDNPRLRKRGFPGGGWCVGHRYM